MQQDRDELGPESVSIEEIRPNKRRGLWIAGALVLVLAAGGYGAARVIDSKNRAHTQKAWNEFSSCLLGAPLAPGEKASRRVRNIQLEVLSLPREKRAAAGELPWPVRCGNYAHGVSEALLESGAPKEGLSQSCEHLAKELKDNENALLPMSQWVDKVWQEASAQGLVAQPVSGPAPQPLSPAAPLTQDSLPKPSRFLPATFALSNIRPQPFSRSSELAFLVDQRDLPSGPVLCQLGAKDTSIRCTKVPEAAAKFSPGLSLWGSTEPGAEPFVFAGDRGAAGIFRLKDGKSFGATMTYGTLARKDGSLELLSWNDKKKEVLWTQRSADGQESEKTFLKYKEIGNPYYNLGFFWDWTVYKAFNNQAEGIRLLVRPVGQPGQPPGPAQDIGEIAEASSVEGSDEIAHLSACQMGEGMAVRVKGSRHEYFAFRVAGRWVEPVEAPWYAGALSCGAAEAVTTSVRHWAEEGHDQATVLQNRCNVSGCSTASVELKELLVGRPELMPTEQSKVAASEVDGKLAIIWQAGEAGGTRLRLGPIDRLREAPEKPLYDDLVQEGSIQKLSSLLELRLISAGPFAVLFVSTVSGVYTYRIDGSGALTPLGYSL